MDIEINSFLGKLLEPLRSTGVCTTPETVCKVAAKGQVTAMARLKEGSPARGEALLQTLWAPCFLRYYESEVSVSEWQ